MNSKERIMRTLNLQEPDRIPVNVRYIEPFEHLWNDPFERARILREMGIDDFLRTTHSWAYRPEVREDVSWDTLGDKKEPLMISKYHTPAGTLTTTVQMTDDYNVQRLDLGSSNLMPRTVEYLIKELDDLERLRFLLSDPADSDTSGFDTITRRMIEFGESEGFPTGVYIPSYSGFSMKNVGTLNLVTRAMDKDPLVEGILDLYLDWTLKWVDYAVRFDPDIIYFSGVFQGLDFWSPELFGELFAPRNRVLAERVHKYGKKFLFFLASTNLDMLIHPLRNMGIDALYSIDPTPPGCAPVDLVSLKTALGEKMALWGGINALMTVARGTPEEVHEAVRYAINSLAPGGGFVLMPAGSIYYEQAVFGPEQKRYKGKPEHSRPYKNLKTFFKSAKELQVQP